MREFSVSLLTSLTCVFLYSFFTVDFALTILDGYGFFIFLLVVVVLICIAVVGWDCVIVYNVLLCAVTLLRIACEAFFASIIKVHKNITGKCVATENYRKNWYRQSPLTLTLTSTTVA